MCLPASDAAVKRSQAAAETDKQEEPHQSKQRENERARVRGCVGRKAIVPERACQFGVGAEDLVSFYAVVKGARRVALFRTTRLTR